MIPQTAVDCNARPGDLPQLAGEVGQSFGDFELLGAHCLAAPAADAGGGPLLLRQGFHRHGGDKAAAGEGVLVVEGQQLFSCITALPDDQRQDGSRDEL